MSDDRAERIAVTVSVIAFWLTAVLIPVMIAMLWGAFPRTADGGERDPRLFLAVTAVPMLPCFALLAAGTWNIRLFLDWRRHFGGLDVLSLTSAVCLAILLTLAADFSVKDFERLYNPAPAEMAATTAFLLSGAPGYSIGQIITADGGVNRGLGV